MIKKNDILIFSECLEQGDEYALMIALDDEFTPSKVPMVRVQELNTDLPLPPINVFEASYYKVIGHAEKGDTPETIVKKYLPKDKWLSK